MTAAPWPFPVWENDTMVKHKFKRPPKPEAPELPVAPF